MPSKKTGKRKSSRGAKHRGKGLVGVARSIGSTLGAVAATAGEAAKELGVFTKAVQKSTVGTTRKVYKQVKETVSAHTPGMGHTKKSRARKSSAKKSSAKSRTKKRSATASHRASRSTGGHRAGRIQRSTTTHLPKPLTTVEPSESPTT